MKRKLNETEIELTNKGIKSRTKQIKENEEAIKIHNKHREFIKVQREYEDLIKPYNRRIEDKNAKVKIDKFESDLKIANDNIKELKDQLINGVEIKEAPGVN